MMKKKKPNASFIVALFFFGLFFVFAGGAFGVEPKPGDVISSSNIDQYQDYFVPYIAQYIKDGWGFVKPVTVYVRESEKFPMGRAYSEASKNNIGKVNLTPDGLLEGYPNLGLPFTDPKEPNLALKVMWNRYYTWFVDDWSMPGGTYHTFAQRKGGPIAHSTASYDCVRFSNRTMIDPIPEHPNPSGLFWSTLLNSETPPNKDMASLTWRYKDPLKDDDMWTYIPTMRRALRLVSSERANPIRGTPMTWDDIFGFDGKIPMFTYKLLKEQKIMILGHQQRWLREVPGAKYEHPIVFGPEEPWEIKDAYVIEVTSKNPRHPESKRIIWVMPENWKINYAAIYDKAGNFWRAYWQSQKCVTVRSGGGQEEEGYCFTMTMGINDLKTYYWTLGYFDAVLLNRGLDPNIFSPTALGK